jgi:hypothetical protein
MIATSDKYKAGVYTTTYARHFIANVLFKLVDVTARKNHEYTFSDPSFYSFLSQLYDDIVQSSFTYGTLEDYQFLLDGSKKIMPDYSLKVGQYGTCSESMTGADGNFAEPIHLDCFYDEAINTSGRTMYFDENYDAVPKDFDVIYYYRGNVIHTEKIRGNTKLVWSLIIQTTDYDHIRFVFYSMTKPYRRLHVIEDIPGLYLSYDDTQIISISYTQEIDIFGATLPAGEVDIQVENSQQQIDILNTQGFTRYLQLRQPIEVSLTQVFQDDSKETVSLLLAYLSDWKVNKGALDAQFTGRDALDKLSDNEFIAGTFPANGQVSLYDCAVQVLEDAGITDYEIAPELQSIYTQAPLPIGTHKDVLRIIAQAGLSIVTCDVRGRIYVKFMSPLRNATNAVLNSAFDNDFDNWTQTNCTLDGTQLYSGRQSCKMAANSTLSQNITGIVGHKVYVRFYVNPVNDVITGTNGGLFINDEQITPNLVESNIGVYRWTLISAIYTVTSASQVMAIKNMASEFNVDSLMYLDLSTIYGDGLEPDKTWCDENIRYFNGAALIPRAHDPEKTDTIDLSVLSETPEIATKTNIKAIETNIYAYRGAAEESEIYQGTRVVNGTEEFSVKFNSFAKNCSITVRTVDENDEPTEVNGATLVSSSIYAQAAKLKVTAHGRVRVIVTGIAYSAQTSQLTMPNLYTIDSSLSAKTETLDNALLTTQKMAEDATSYAMYWYNRGLTYSFDWRQNPAVEVLDYVQVYDEFGKNNTILITQRTVEYTNGVLGGSSEGVY